MEADGRPNPITKAAETASSNLPRAARARIGMTTDPVPEGKEVQAAPEHHFDIKPATHDVERTTPTDPDEMSLVERDSQMKELAKTHGGEDLMRKMASQSKQGMDRKAASTAPNKRMDSRHRGATSGGQ